MALFPSLALLFARPTNLGMDNPHMPRKCVIAGKGFLLRAQMAADLLFSRIVDRIFMPRKIIWPRENGVARLARRRIDALAFVRTRLRVSQRTGTIA